MQKQNKLPPKILFELRKIDEVIRYKINIQKLIIYFENKHIKMKIEKLFHL